MCGGGGGVSCSTRPVTVCMWGSTCAIFNLDLYRYTLYFSILQAVAMNNKVDLPPVLRDIVHHFCVPNSLGSFGVTYCQIEHPSDDKLL